LMWGIGDSMVDGLIGAIQNKGWQLLSTLRDIVNRAIEAAKRAIGWGSPSKVFAGIGESMMQGLTEGIENLTKMPTIAVQHAVNMSVAGASSAATGGGVSNTTLNLHFGAGSVRSNKDIRDIADAMQHSLHLYGVKAAK